MSEGKDRRQITFATDIRDFPDWFGAILVKELRQGLKTRAFEATYIALQVVFVGIITWMMIVHAGPRERFLCGIVLNGIFWGLIAVYFLWITPLRALNELAAEKRAGALELVFMSGLTPWRIVIGKWLALLVQAVLFLIAMLPYGMMRYYFGRVHLADDFLNLAVLLLLSAAVSALAIAVSALPVIFRVVVPIGVLAFLAYRLSHFHAFARSPIDFLVGIFEKPSALPVCRSALVLFDGITLTVAALEFGAGSIAPPAENHALRQRLLSFALLLPLLYLLNSPRFVKEADWQITLFAGVALFTAWVHLASSPVIFRRHLAPFSRFGRLGFWVGSAFQPGWPGATLYMVGAVAATCVCAFLSPRQEEAGWMRNSSWFRDWAEVWLANATLMTLALLWLLARRRSRFALGEQLVFLGLVVALALAMISIEYNWQIPPGANVIWALFPPVGLCCMLKTPADDLHGFWFIPSGLAFMGYFLALRGFARPFWLKSHAVFDKLRAATRNHRTDVR